MCKLPTWDETQIFRLAMENNIGQNILLLKLNFPYDVADSSITLNLINISCVYSWVSYSWIAVKSNRNLTRDHTIEKKQ